MQTLNLSDGEFNIFQSLVLEKSGLYFSRDRASLIEGAISQGMEKHKLKAVSEYYDLIVSDQNEFSSFVELLTIGETYFFRNNHQFDALKDTVLKEIQEARLFSGRKLKIWSAGCSTGEEPYTIAMILLENLPVFGDWEISILATDINESFLSRAKEGIYSERSVSQVPDEYLQKYFRKVGNKYFLSDNVKKLVKFEKHNMVVDQSDLEGMVDVDIIFCRNVIIYFDLETIKHSIKRFYRLLADGGYLFLGYSESLWQISEDFSYIEFPQTFIYKKELFLEKKPPKPFIPIPEFFMQEYIPPAAQPTVQVVHEEKAREDVRPHMKKAIEYANSGDYESAISELKHVVGLDNLYLECYYLMGVLCEKTGKMKEAIAEFKRVVYIDSQFALAYFNLANIHHFQKNYKEAKREYLNAIKILEKQRPDDLIPFTENLTVDLLLASSRRGLETTVEK